MINATDFMVNLDGWFCGVTPQSVGAGLTKLSEEVRASYAVVREVKIEETADEEFHTKTITIKLTEKSK